ncbi:TPM domain-containing protein [Streptococcus sp. CF4-2]|uniref:TPM domain-containing protein n=1 Tax=unclassified Streptococcus TaxID=2608887 RepID=UPI0020C85125|nr:MULTISPECIES: TPM domain-containing protein [unclassified Streptococcus]MCP9074978.1 TPM domain-containing protein [Streptococcus sp. CF4-3]MCP9088088.1 TPM domain-containing protein [Streptococcus sp. CF4-2]
MKKDRLLKNPFLVRLLGLLMVFLFLSAFTAPEKPDYGIYDPNHYLTEEVVTQIRDLNEANSQKAEKLQIGVYIVDSLEGESIETVANETARAWKIGYSGDNFGSLIVVAVQDRKSRIETSNNTAIRITDYQTKQILAASRTDFKTGDYGKGILAIAKALDNQFYRGSGTFSSDDDSSDIKRYSESISGKKSSRNSNSSSHRKNSDPMDNVFGVGIIIYFIIVFIAIIRGGGGGRGGGSSDGGWWFSDSSDSGSSWSDSGSDSSSSWDGGGFDGGGSSDDW